MKKVDQVVHFAAKSHVDRSIEDGSVFVRTNVLGTNALLQRKAGRRYSIDFEIISTNLEGLSE
jgi:dTDP-D-glucose 4,6-dehydratase